MNYYIGVDIGGTKIAYGLFDSNRQLLAKKKTPSDDALGGEEYFGRVAEELQHFVKNEKISFTDIKGIGIGIAGFVDFDQGRLVRAASLPKLIDFWVLNFLKEKLGEDVKIVLDNDCHCGALAEYRRGAGRSYKHMLYCPISTGISSGIIIDGKLFRGSDGASGESGHMLTAVEGPLKISCGCGNEGCFNSLCSGKNIAIHIRRWISQGEETIMTELAGGPENITAVHINQAYDLGDAMAKKAVEQMAKYMAIWLFDVYSLLNINCFVFSGGLLKMGDKLLNRVKNLFTEYQTNGFPVYFYETELGVDSGLIGAVELLFSE